ncbi:hypothetical protein OIU84_026329 [Salix udensis]|uniref:Kelch repeat-containing F-box family protein n=1 Tax=Salix udensis TaxID=889485 RepID=A0AAD6PDG1_9ROSI|nr:hypothetical protein OIU84_026329 [Salix udensis]
MASVFKWISTINHVTFARLSLYLDHHTDPRVTITSSQNSSFDFKNISRLCEHVVVRHIEKVKASNTQTETINISRCYCYNNLVSSSSISIEQGSSSCHQTCKHAENSTSLFKKEEEDGRVNTSKDFYYQRKEEGFTHKAACLIQAVLGQTGSSQTKPAGPLKYGVSIFDSVSGSWDRIDPVPVYPDGLPLFCQVTSSEGKLVLLGGWDPVKYEPLSQVFVYEFTTRQWKRGKEMPENRSFFAAGELNGQIIISGGHDENKNADEWAELPHMSQERDECEGVVIGSEFWVVSGYRTDSQGGFEGSAESIEVGASKWKRVDDAWKVAQEQCPRSSLGVGRDGHLFSWAESVSEVKVGTCGVQLGERTFLSGSGYEGGPQGFFACEWAKW